MAAMKVDVSWTVYEQTGYSPFERFNWGDAGLTNNFGLLGYDIYPERISRIPELRSEGES